MSQIKISQLVKTLTATVGVVYVICAVLASVAQQTLLQLGNLLFHGIDLTKIPRAPTLGEAVPGFVVAMIVTALIAWLAGSLWNSFDSERRR